MAELSVLFLCCQLRFVHLLYSSAIQQALWSYNLLHLVMVRMIMMITRDASFRHLDLGSYTLNSLIVQTNMCNIT